MSHRKGCALRRRYGRAYALTSDVLPYSGVGVASPGEYKAQIAFLRAVKKAEETHRRDPDPWAVNRFLQDSDTMSNEYRGAMATLRGGLVRQSGHDHTGPHRLTPYGRVYLAQREATR
jgi:hypothetical protein